MRGAARGMAGVAVGGAAALRGSSNGNRASYLHQLNGTKWERTPAKIPSPLPYS
jgi:hypothetical protein